MSSTTARLSTGHQQSRVALALLGVPGSTIAWDLPAGGFWIGMPLAVAAIAIGLRARADAGATGRRMAAAAITSMRERSTELGGSFEITPADGGGTLARVRLPLPGQAQKRTAGSC
jgi:hypothetical protein